jgi:hypothetical protein
MAAEGGGLRSQASGSHDRRLMPRRLAARWFARRRPAAAAHRPPQPPHRLSLVTRIGNGGADQTALLLLL